MHKYIDVFLTSKVWTLFYTLLFHLMYFRDHHITIENHMAFLQLHIILTCEYLLVYSISALLLNIFIVSSLHYFK